MDCYKRVNKKKKEEKKHKPRNKIASHPNETDSLFSALADIHAIVTTHTHTHTIHIQPSHTTVHFANDSIVPHQRSLLSSKLSGFLD